MSKRYSLAREDLKKIGIGAGVAISGALLTYVSETLTQIDFGEWTPIVVSVWSIVANMVRKFISEYPDPGK